MPYQAPLKDMLFVMNELADLAGVNALPGNEDATPDTAEAVLEENAKFVSNVIAPLNNASDKEPSFWHDGQVTTSKGFKEAFKAFGEAGWQGVQHPVDCGGQGLPSCWRRRASRCSTRAVSPASWWPCCRTARSRR